MNDTIKGIRAMRPARLPAAADGAETIHPIALRVIRALIAHQLQGAGEPTTFPTGGVEPAGTAEGLLRPAAMGDEDGYVALA